MNDDINEYVPSILNPRTRRKNSADFTLTQNSIISRCSLSLKRNNNGLPAKNSLNKAISQNNKENCFSVCSNNVKKTIVKAPSVKTIGCHSSIGFSVIEDIVSRNSRNLRSSPQSFGEVIPIPTKNVLERSQNVTATLMPNKVDVTDDESVISVSSATELGSIASVKSDKTIFYDIQNFHPPNLYLSFCMIDCDTIDLSSKNLTIRNIKFSHESNDVTVNCEVVEGSQVSTDSEDSENMNQSASTTNSLKRSAAAVNLEIKKKKVSTEDNKEKVLILKTDSIDKLSHVILQPPSYKLLKKQQDSNKLTRPKKCTSNYGKGQIGNLKQTTIDKYIKKNPNVDSLLDSSVNTVNEELNVTNDVNNVEMIKNLNFNDGFKLRCQTGRSSYQSSKNELSPHLSPRSYKVNPSIRDISHQSSPSSLRRSEARTLSLEGPRASSSKSPRGNLSPKKNAQSLQFTIPTPPARPTAAKIQTTVKAIPHFKIVAGTHFAVDAFSYGEIPNVEHYFLTHFHSDHYSGLRKSFNKSLYCSSITAELCKTRLGVNAKCITVVNIDDTLHIDGVEVTAVDANHCPGAIMLVFTLPNGKSVLHTGDFRAYPAMESFPVFWNKDIHTIYLDTTYCNPRYDFPTQEDSLEMALYILRQKKMALEKAGKKFSQVLIVCGTYTIGKEKFFLGMARRVGCSVWACAEKDRVLRAVEGRSFAHAPPRACQLHVVPMRDLAVDKLRQYLDNLQGAFSEVVAFKPSGWENGKNSAVEADKVTIYGIPYSEHSSFSEMVRFVKFLKPKQVVPTVDIQNGAKAVQKFFPCPLVLKEGAAQSRVTEYFSIQSKQQPAAVT